MIAKDKLLELSSLTGIHKAREHFLNISGTAVYVRDDFKANLDELTTTANLLVNDILHGNIDTEIVKANLLADDMIQGNIDKVIFKGELYE